ncbi:galanin receptor type 2-like [Acanthaster planci]|uniref:Galanin receptor type 2-like n=1 Tax=Acanthaster planci TaxID=133434 RepID=A0A8B7Z5P8_ACAPL|nr:galanin receptor type 2-like [Acanthaster planci]
MPFTPLKPDFHVFVASTLNLVVLTAERYVAIMYPFKYLTHFRKKQVVVMLTVWSVAILYKSHNAFYYTIEDETCKFRNLSKEASIAMGTTAFFFEYLNPLIFMSFCYVHIIHQLKKSSSIVNPESSSNQQSDNSMSGSLLRARRNTLKTFFIVFVTYTICWSPNQIAFFVFNFGLPLNFQGVFYNMSMVLVQLNTCVNPIIYAFKYRQFQNSLRVLFKPCLPNLPLRVDQQLASTISSRLQPLKSQKMRAKSQEMRENS